MKNPMSLFVLTGFTLAGCASQPIALQPSDVPHLYEKPLATEATASACEVAGAELEKIDLGLGQTAEETPIAPPPTGAERATTYVKELVVQSALGPIQPVIQTYRALANSEAKEAVREEVITRGSLRQAYLSGFIDASNCEAG